MIGRIRDLAAAATFDFREFAAPDDPLRHLFDEWVPYYRMKYAIAKALAPRSILEIGVRYGYSAHAFLAAAPDASYVGIDNASATFGGDVGALAFARRSLAGHRAELLELDSQRLDTLPGQWYDLVHVDGQQDGDGTFHDLALALGKARWILLDGYLWSRQNMLSATYFVEKYRTLIESVQVLPGYAGEMLIETRARPGRPLALRAEGGHESLRDAYDSDYFLHDCGGHAEFKRSHGRQLVDPRLVAMYELAGLRRGMHVLDVGCGRGELAFAAHAGGAHVVGVDYAADAIAIARRTYADVLGDTLQFVEADVLDYEPERRFDRIFAGDVVEHLAPDALDRMFERLSRWLAPDGRLVVHTWPNRIAYERGHRARRRAALAAGSWLPRSPRTYYEDLMHINEQTPSRLRRALGRHFPAVHVFAADSADPARGLDRPLREAVATGESLFAIAGREPVPPAGIRAALSQELLDADAVARIRVVALEVPDAVETGREFSATGVIANEGAATLRSTGANPVHIAYHWERDGVVVCQEGRRSPLAPPLRGGMQQRYAFTVQAPVEPGRYVLVATLVQEGRFWFDALDPRHAGRATVDVSMRETAAAGSRQE